MKHKEEFLYVILFFEENSIFFQSCPYTELRMGDFARISGAALVRADRKRLPDHIKTRRGSAEMEQNMARGPKKTLEEKIAAKEELIDALMTRIESEKQELAAMYQEKRNAQLENIGNMLQEWELSPQEAEEALRRYVDQREEEAS